MYTRAFEKLVMFINSPPSFYWGLLFLAVCLLGIGHFLDLPLLGLSLIFTMMYVWSKYEPDTIVSFFWGFQVKGFQLPFAFMILNVVTGGSLMTGLVGLVVGEVFYLLKEKVPHDYGWDLLNPPGFFIGIVEKFQRPVRAQAQAPGVWGRGQRLG